MDLLEVTQVLQELVVSFEIEKVCRFIVGLAVPILHASTIMAESEALHFGLKILTYLQLNDIHVIVETDSKFIHHCIKQPFGDIPWEVACVIQECSHLISTPGKD
ncbi:hypothetical protein IFM89_009198 [Coptis chinensis]|uniref:Uncharacterized protein n=1 Tax=Coptis chinensis TaxID=261450 RepID=A0A835ISH8_9MAGN|nr:hypothetical protein IFM89_009198 [Coptis chinensis]